MLQTTLDRARALRRHPQFAAGALLGIAVLLIIFGLLHPSARTVVIGPQNAGSTISVRVGDTVAIQGYAGGGESLLSPRPSPPAGLPNSASTFTVTAPGRAVIHLIAFEERPVILEASG